MEMKKNLQNIILGLVTAGVMTSCTTTSSIRKGETLDENTARYVESQSRKYANTVDREARCIESSGEQIYKTKADAMNAVNQCVDSKEMTDKLFWYIIGTVADGFKLNYFLGGASGPTGIDTGVTPPSNPISKPITIGGGTSNNGIGNGFR